MLAVACEGTDLLGGCQLNCCKEPIEMYTDSFTIQELGQAICGLKNSKAPGVDNSNAEMLKANPTFTLNQLLNICNQTLDQCKAWPSDWRKALWAKIPKKGDRSICDCNYPRIFFLSVP